MDPKIEDTDHQTENLRFFENRKRTKKMRKWTQKRGTGPKRGN